MPWGIPLRRITPVPGYRRWWDKGGTYFFTLVTHERRPILTTSLGRECLRCSLAECRETQPFRLDAIVLMPDHLHLILRLPPDDDQFAKRLARIKRGFTRTYLLGGGAEGAPTPSRLRQRYRGIWQKRYYEHRIRGWKDYRLHLDYIHANPVKHGLAAKPADWPWSTFMAWVQRGEYDQSWCGQVATPGGVDIEPDTW